MFMKKMIYGFKKTTANNAKKNIKKSVFKRKVISNKSVTILKKEYLTFALIKEQIYGI